MKRFAAQAAIGILLLALTSVRAQTPTGTIQGTVPDESGAAVPNARIVITNIQTNEISCATASNANCKTLPRRRRFDPAIASDLGVSAGHLSRFSRAARA